MYFCIGVRSVFDPSNKNSSKIFPVGLEFFEINASFVFKQTLDSAADKTHKNSRISASIYCKISIVS